MPGPPSRPSCAPWLSALLAASAGVIATVGPSGHAHDGGHTHAADGFIDLSAKPAAATLTGNDAHPYRLAVDWPKPLPDGRPLGPTHGGIAIGPEGLIYASSNKQGQGVFCFTPEGQMLGAIGGDELANLHNLTVRIQDGQPVFYGAQPQKKRAVKFDARGNILWSINFDRVAEHYPHGRADFKPTALTVGPNGDIYLADGDGLSLIHQFDAHRGYIRTFGGKGEADGQFMTPHGITIDTRYDPARLLICDRENKRLVHHALDGSFIQVVATDLRRPCAASILGDHVAVAELQGRVTILDADNKPAAFLGDNPDRKQWAQYRVTPEKMTPGVFTAPHGLSFDPQGNLYVMDWNQTGRITKLNRLAPMPIAHNEIHTRSTN